MNRILIGLFIFSLIALALLSCKPTNTSSAGIERYNKGVSFLEEGAYDNAIIEFKAALQADPKNFEAQKNLAGAYLYKDEWEQARDNYIIARDMRPNDPSIYVNLALVYQHLGEPQLAWDNISKAKDIDERYPLLHYRAGELFLAQGYKDEAMVAFGDAIRLEPEGSRLAENAQEMIDRITSGETIPLDISDESTQVSLVEDEEALDEENPDEEITDEEALDESESEETVDETDEDETTPDEETVDEETATDDETIADTTTEDVTTEETPDETVDEVVEPELPALEGDELYNDRLSRGRQMRARGSYPEAIDLLLEAYDVHPYYAQINYELGLSYYFNEQPLLAKPHLEKYLEVGTDPDLRATVEEKLDEVNAALGVS